MTGHDASRAVLVTGHRFGISAFEGLLASPAYLQGRVEVPLMIGLDAELAGGTVGYQPIGPLASSYGVPHLSTTDGRLTSLADTIRGCQPDYVLVIGWSRLVATEVLAIPRYGCVGMHPTKLPLGRGQAPIPWTIIKGLDHTALSVFYLEAAADTGSLIAQYELDVHPRETAASLFSRMAVTHFTAGFELGAAIGRGEVPALPQDPAKASVWGKRRPADGEITATMCHAEIDALVRALLGPYPRAFVTVDGRRHEIRAVEYLGPAGPPGPAGRSGPAAADLVAADRIHFTCHDAVLSLLLADSKTTR